MQQYADVVMSTRGFPIEGATVTVTDAGGASSLYSGNGTGALGSNVLTTDATGSYSFYAANGRYTLTIAGDGYTGATRDVVLWDFEDDRVNAADQAYGADPTGVADSSAAIVAALNALDFGDIDDGAVGVSQRNHVLQLPAGVFRMASNLAIAMNAAVNKFQIRGAGPNNTVLLFEATTGDAIAITGFMGEITDLSVFGTAARKAGTGRGIVVDASLGSTSPLVTFRNVQVQNHAGDGIELVRTEQHTLDGVWVQNCGGRGIYLNHGSGQSSWNYLVNCRAANNGGIGIELSSGANHNTLTNCEALDNAGPDQIKIQGRSNVLINPDAECANTVTSGTSFVGIKLTGSRHKIIGGYVGDVNTGVSLVSATDCVVDEPTITNGGSGVAATNAVLTDVNSLRNRFLLATSFTNFTNALNPSTGQDFDMIWQGGKVTTTKARANDYSVSYAASVTPTSGWGGNVRVGALTGNITVNNPTGAFDFGDELEFYFVQDGSGGRTITWGAAFRTTYTDTGNAAFKRNIVRFKHDGSAWIQVYLGGWVG